MRHNILSCISTGVRSKTISGTCNTTRKYLQVTFGAWMLKRHTLNNSFLSYRIRLIFLGFVAIIFILFYLLFEMIINYDWEMFIWCWFIDRISCVNGFMFRVFLCQFLWIFWMLFGVFIVCIVWLFVSDKWLHAIYGNSFRNYSKLTALELVLLNRLNIISNSGKSVALLTISESIKNLL